MPTSRVRITFAVALTSIVTSARPGLADGIVVYPSRDVTLYQESGALGDGKGSYLFVGHNGKGSERRALLHFDLSHSIPAGATLTAATLRLSASRGRDTTVEVALHRVTAEWAEGATRAPGNEGGGKVAAMGDATWTYSTSDMTPWSVPGGDFVPEPSATASVGPPGSTYEWTGDGLLDDVRRFVSNPADNRGWIAVPSPTSAHASKRFGSRDGGAASRPALAVEFQPPSEPHGACCGADGSCGVVLDPGNDCVGVYEGSGTKCEPGVCPAPKGACCAANAAATCSQDTDDECTRRGSTWLGPGQPCSVDTCPVVLTPFVEPLPIPPVATPTEGSAGGVASYRLSMVQSRVSLHPDLPETTVWGYTDGVSTPGMLGPTIVARRGSPIRVTWVNDLRDDQGALLTRHPLPIEHCIHGAADDSPRAVVHLHGGHVPAEFDGHPELTLLPGDETTYEYPNHQPSATLWYHDHALGITRLNVIQGLAGAYVLEDAEDPKLDLPSGQYDIPLVLQDRTFGADGQFKYPAAWQEHFFGDTPVVNGKVAPHLEVDRGKYRFRIVNGSTSRFYRLGLSSREEYFQIASDGGLLPKRVLWSPGPDESGYGVVVAPGERVELVVDFAGHSPGDRIVLENSAPTPYPNGGDDHPMRDLLQFVVRDAPGFTADVPLELRPLERLREADAVATRTFRLERMPSDCGGSMWMINGRMWADIDERPHLGTTEIWEFENRSGFTHPMHLHLVMFQVLDRRPFQLDADGGAVPTRTPLPAIRDESGWKDTVQVGPFETVRVIARFDDHAGRFPYHCHILEHEDHEMMRQFEAVAVCGDGALAHGYEECDDGNQQGGDGCSADCRIEREGGADAGSDDSPGAPRSPTPTPPRPSGDCGCRIAERHVASPVGGLAALPVALRRRRRRGAGRSGGRRTVAFGSPRSHNIGEAKSGS
ncbi:MAG TPA: multicopper oxidase domain-containing protein [Polyangiaceae bacterium]|nr:multicopper oxidase domain-containing protein [Polyangiaceae bacterium]